MPRFFVRRNQIDGNKITILGDDAKHISRSLRMAVGDNVTVCDMQSVEYECSLVEFLPDRVEAEIISSRACDTEPPYSVTLYQALPKGDKLDTVIQKAVECGVYEIVPFVSERCIAKESSREENKLSRRQRIALEAAKQCGRGIIPCVKPTASFSEMLKSAAEADIAIMCYEGDGTVSFKEALSNAKRAVADLKNPSVSVVIGSEGGFSLDEVEQARAAGLIPVGLGKRILRTETAPSVALSCLIYEFEL